MQLQSFYGVFVNTATVLVGSSVGLLLKKGIPERISKAVMIALGLCTIYIGIDGALEGENTIVLIVSMVLGTITGSLIDIDKWINKAGTFFENKMKKKDGSVSVAEGFVTSSMVFCVGSLTIVGCLNAGLTGDNELIYTKAVLDLISSCMMASALGIGVLFASAFVFGFQGILVLLSGLLSGVLTNDAIIAEMTCAGSVMIIGLGFNLIGLSKFKTANMLPAIVFAPFVYMAAQYLPI